MKSVVLVDKKMKFKLLLGLALALMAVEAVISSYDIKSIFLVVIPAPQQNLCPDYDVNPEQEALTHCIEHPRRTDKPVYNHPSYCEKFKPHGSAGFDLKFNQEDNRQFAQMRCPLG